MKLWIIGALMLCCHISQAQENQDSIFIKKMADNILTQGKAYTWLHQLTKTIGGRLSGSKQAYMAEAWGKQRLQEAGAETITMQPCLVTHWKRGKTTEVQLVVNGKTIPVPALTLGNSVGTNHKTVEGNLIEVKSFAELDSLKNSLKNKVVFFNCDFDETQINTFKAYGKSAKYRVWGASKAAAYGAKAVLVRSMTHSADNLAHTGTLVYIDSLPKIPAFAIGLDDVKKLSSLCKQNPTIMARVKSDAELLPDTLAHNVIGIIKGQVQPEKIITVGGHLDSWDVNEGAHDDGAGIVQTIEVLRVFQSLGYKPKHTIHFVLFANEENGAKGAKTYADSAKQANEKHFFALESDAGGFTPRGFSISNFNDKKELLLQWQKLLFSYGCTYFISGGSGTDIAPLAQQFGTVVAELEPDSQRYFDVHHSAKDVYEQVNKRELLLGAVNMAALIYLVDQYEFEGKP